jgi:hypothetical protein
MDDSTGRPAAEADIARLAHALWEAEGRPDGRDREHWRRAREMLESGEAEARSDAEAREAAGHAPRPVQPGFEDARPGMVPDMKQATAPGELREEPGGRFAKQLAELPEGEGEGRQSEKPGPRNPAPVPPTGREGHLAIPSNADAAAGAASADPAPPASGGRMRRKPGR